MTRAAIRSILIAGDGIVGLSAALAFSRALPGVAVSLLRLPEDPAAVADHFATTLPSVGRFHATIGIDELDLVRRGLAVHHLGTRFDGGPCGAWTHTFGDVGRGEGTVPFHQIWLAAKQSGRAFAFDRYSPASVFGNVGKFVHPSNDPASPLATYLYGLRMHPQRYREMLDAAAADVPRTSGTIATIDRDEGGTIAGLVLTDGHRVEADLYVDCSGPAAILANAIDQGFDDWSSHLPAYHIETQSLAEAASDPLSHVRFNRDGWHLTATVPGATLRATLTTTPTAQSTAFRPGRRQNAFVANVLAIGDSAIMLDPLHGANLSLAHDAILRAIDLLPGRDCHPLELAEYNRLTALQADRARDYHALFQLSATAGSSPPDSLARTLTQWRSRGRLPFFEEETFTPSSWMQMLIGLGIVPDDVAPMARSIDADSAASAMAAFALELEQLAARLPTYRDYLARVGVTPVSTAGAS